MALPTYVTAGAASASSGTGAKTVAVPAHQAGDILVLVALPGIVGAPFDGAASTPSGWTAFAGNPYGAYVKAHLFWIKDTDNSISGNVSVTFSGTATGTYPTWLAQILVFRGADSISTISSLSSYPPPVNFATINPPDVDDYLAVSVSYLFSNNTLSAGTGGNGSWTVRSNISTTANAHATICTQTAPADTDTTISGDSAAYTSSWSGLSTNVGFLLTPAAETETTNLQDSAANSPPQLLTDLDDADINSPDANKWSPVSNTDPTTVRLGFPTPSGTLSGAQQFKANLFCTSGSPTTPAKGKLTLYENGVAVSPEVSIEANITSTSGQVVTLDWDASDVADQTGTDVEIRFDGTPGTTSGSPINTVGINSAQWVTQFVATTIDLDPAALTLAGQTLTVAQTIPLEAAALTLAGQDFLVIPGPIILEAAALTLAGQELSVSGVETLEAAALTFAGQELTVAAAEIIILDPAALDLSGELAVGVGLVLEPASLTFAGEFFLVENIVATVAVRPIQGRQISLGLGVSL